MKTTTKVLLSITLTLATISCGYPPLILEGDHRYIDLNKKKSSDDNNEETDQTDSENPENNFNNPQQQEPNTSPSLNIHPDTNTEFHPFIERFAQYAQEYGRQTDAQSIPIRLGTTSAENVAGTCWQRSDGVKRITINREWWSANTNIDTREAVIFHELGHCSLNRGHDNFKENGIQQSLMASVLNYYQILNYQKYRRAYLRELFTGSKDGF